MRKPISQEKKILSQYESYKAVFGSVDGKKVLYDMFRAHNVMSTTYCGNDPIGMAMREGERQVVIRILQIIKTDMGKLEKMMEEANDGND